MLIRIKQYLFSITHLSKQYYIGAIKQIPKKGIGNVNQTAAFNTITRTEVSLIIIDYIGFSLSIFMKI